MREFGCYTPDLLATVAWLKQCAVETVAMESTGVYWIPVFQMLEGEGFEVILVNAHHVKSVPGRKSDSIVKGYDSYTVMACCLGHFVLPTRCVC